MTNKPFKIYSDNIEQIALDQFHDAMAQDFVVQGALMPDAHMGYSLPIGAVVATRGVVVPAWVGYDIGCGMAAVKTTHMVDEVRDRAAEIFDRIYELVPVGFNVHETGSKPKGLDPDELSELGRSAFDKRKGFRHMGTLGGGNHFIEIGSDSGGAVWIVIHSGSRGIGHGIATEYMKLASGTGKAKEGHYGFDDISDEGNAYINDMDWALGFALANRGKMTMQVIDAINDCIGATGLPLADTFINSNHNHVEMTNGLWVHRKGATHARDGMMGVIPGNMRDGSFIVRGKGNPDSLCSSSHGAGRVLGRKAAKRELETSDFVDQMRGITAKVGPETLDESPSAYKDIHEVMRNQRDLVDIVEHVKPIINIKG